MKIIIYFIKYFVSKKIKLWKILSFVELNCNSRKLYYLHRKELFCIYDIHHLTENISISVKYTKRRIKQNFMFTLFSGAFCEAFCAFYHRKWIFN